MQILIIPDLFEDHRRWQAVLDGFKAAGVEASIFEYEAPRGEDVSDTIEYLNRFLIDETCFVGTGIGGRLALQIAARQPHHLAGLVLMSTPAVPAPGVTKLGFKVLRMVTAPIRILIPFKIRKKITAWYKKSRPVSPQKALYQEVAAPTLEAFLMKIADPLLLLWGAEDERVPPSVATVMAEILQEHDVAFDTQVVAGAKSNLHVTHPELVVSATLSLLKKEPV